MTDGSSRGVRVLLVSDPGLPTRRSQSIKGGLQEHLNEVFSPPVELHTRTAMLRLRPDNSLDLSDVVQLAKEYERPDVVLLLTEIPRLADGRPLIAEIFPDEQVAVISCPTLGAFASRRRILDTLMDCILKMTPVNEGSGTSQFGRSWLHWSDAGEAGAHSTLHASPAVGGVRTVLGMVAGNEPRKTAPRLSSALAAASATGAFGIFYSSIWAMSTYLSMPRLVGIGALAIGGLPRG